MSMDRRGVLSALTGLACVGWIGSRVSGGAIASQPEHAGQGGTVPGPRTPLKQSICRWCYGNMELPTLCRHAAELGYKSVELLSEPDWPVVKEFGLDCAVANGPVSIAGGINRVESHAKFVADCEHLLPRVRDAGIDKMIIFSGNRHEGLSDEAGMANCQQALEQVLPIAEKTDVMIIMELLNSKVDHRGYMCDHTRWGVELCQQLDSPHFRLLYDIYHMQIMEGDVIRTIRENRQWLAHFHTGGVPGRAEIDQSQELNYRAICQAIVEDGYTGYLGQEFIPRRDPVESLREAFSICKV